MYESRLKALAMRKMGDSGSWTLENCPLARRAWSLYQSIHMRRDPLARLGGTGCGAGREESQGEDTASADRRCVYTAVPSTPRIHTQGAGLGKAGTGGLRTSCDAC